MHHVNVLPKYKVYYSHDLTDWSLIFINLKHAWMLQVQIVNSDNLGHSYKLKGRKSGAG